MLKRIVISVLILVVGGLLGYYLLRSTRTAAREFRKVTPIRSFEPDDLYPLTLHQARDESTLQERILDDRVIQSRTHPSRKVRIVRARYYSHEWKDGPWYGTVSLVIPQDLPPDHRGLVVFTPGGSINVADDLDFKKEFWERTAMDAGVVVASIPNMGKHFGLTEIHQLSDYMAEQALRSGDLSWAPNYPFVAGRARAVTLIGKLTGHPVRSVVHMGSSITASHAWIWPLFDERVKGLVATGDVGFVRDWFPLDGSLRSKRTALVELSRATPELQNAAIRLADPYDFGDRIRIPVLQIVGTSDFDSPLSTVPKFLAALAGPTHLVNVPNYPHGTGSWRHVRSLRMFIEHIFFERPLTRIERVEFQQDGGQLVVKAKVTGTPTVSEVRFFYTTYSEPNFLKSSFPNTSANNYTKAKWTSAPMNRAADRWVGTVAIPSTRPSFLAGFVDLRDEYADQPGYASSPVQQIRLD